MIEFIFAVCIAVDGDTLRCRMTAAQRTQIARAAPRWVQRRWKRVPYSLSIRLKAINTPEWCEPGYQRAKDAMRAMIRRQTVRCRFRGEWAWPSSRPVMTCFAQGRDVGRVMVRTGLAKACKQFGGERYDPKAKKCKFTKCGRGR